MRRNMLSEICMLLIQCLEPFLYNSIIIIICTRFQVSDRLWTSKKCRIPLDSESVTSLAVIHSKWGKWCSQLAGNHSNYSIREIKYNETNYNYQHGPEVHRIWSSWACTWGSWVASVNRPRLHGTLLAVWSNQSPAINVQPASCHRVITLFTQWIQDVQNNMHVARWNVTNIFLNGKGKNNPTVSETVGSGADPGFHADISHKHDGKCPYSSPDHAQAQQCGKLAKRLLASSARAKATS